MNQEPTITESENENDKKHMPTDEELLEFSKKYPDVNEFSKAVEAEIYKGTNLIQAYETAEKEQEQENLLEQKMLEKLSEDADLRNALNKQAEMGSALSEADSCHQDAFLSGFYKM